MRGKVFERPGGFVEIRITPAYAGKSDLTSGTQTLLQGSPPHVRGKAASAELYFCALGITPAYAGKSIIKDITIPADGDHPRVCGEKGTM